MTLELDHFFPPAMDGKSKRGITFGGNNTLAEVEKEAVLATLDRTSHNRTQAARILAISVKTLRNKLKLYRMDGS